MPPSTSAGKSFTVDTPSDSASVSSDAVATPGRAGRPAARAAFDDRAVQAGGNNERRAGRDRDVHLRHRADGSGADDEALAGEGFDRVRGRRASEGDLDGAGSGTGQRAPELPCGLPALDRDDREDTLLGDDCQCVGHRPSQPPSTGSTTPCT